MNTRILRAAAAACLTLALASQIRAAEIQLPRDGWVSWEVDAVENAPAWCCWKSRQNGVPTGTSCNLDRDNGNFGTRDHSTTDKARVYARLAGGKVDRLRVLSASCPVETQTPIQNISATTDDSARWLIAQSKKADATHDLREHVLAGLAMHRGSLAFNELVSSARSDGPVDARKDAVFWLAMMRGSAGAEAVTDRMFNDPHAGLREHAAFALTQSKSPRIAVNLIKLASTDKDSNVRAQAWFWLAHSGAPEAEAAIATAARKDPDTHVREQAIFALSQLPDERGTRALIKAAEDKSLGNEQRKRAVFWLAQSESKSAQSYLERVLTGKR